MKKIYIPVGETVRYDELHTDVLIVKGKLKVQGKLTARSIQGKGVIEAGEIICDTADVGAATAVTFTAQKIAASKLFITECRAAEIAVTNFIEARMVRVGRLTMSLSSISVCEADEIIVLPQKKRGLLGMLWASWWRSLLLSWKTSSKKQAAKAKKQVPPKPVKPEPKPVSDRQVDDFLAALKRRGYRMEDIYAGEAEEPAA